MKINNRLKIILIGLAGFGFVIIIAILFFIILSIRKADIVPVSNDIYTDCSKVEGYDIDSDVIYNKKDLCYGKEGERDNNIDSCLKIEAYYTKEHCIQDVAVDLKNYNFCNLIPERSDYGRSDLDKWNCMGAVSVSLDDEKTCRSFAYGDVKGDCLKKLADKELSITSYILDSALILAKQDLTNAIKKCQEYHYIRNTKECYYKVSNEYNGGTTDKYSQTAKNSKLVQMCVNNPTDYEWMACIFSGLYDVLVGMEQFKAQVISTDFKLKTFCNLMESSSGEPSRPGNPDGAAYMVGFRDEVCK